MRWSGQLEVALDDGQVVSAGEGEGIGREIGLVVGMTWGRVAGREGIAEEIPFGAPPTSDHRKIPPRRRLHFGEHYLPSSADHARRWFR